MHPMTRGLMGGKRATGYERAENRREGERGFGGESVAFRGERGFGESGCRLA